MALFMEKRQPGVCTIEAPCKINLHLSIGEKRPDGFHELESIFVSLALADTLCFECTGKEAGTRLFMDWEIPEESISPERNLVLKAVSLFREQTGFKKGLNIRVTKRIPAGAGLGGGSSDAASSLLALNFLAGGAGKAPESSLATKELVEMAAILGSDVPFFLNGGGAFVSGRGELIEPVEIPPGLWVVLSKPPFSSDTASAFRLLDRAREREIIKTTEKIPQKRVSKKAVSRKELSKKHVSKKHVSKKRLIRALKDDPATWPFYNDFLPVFLGANLSADRAAGQNAAAYLTILENLRKAGASFTGLSGSGSCCFGIFTSKKAAEIAEKQLSGQENYTRMTFFLAQKAIPVVE